MSLFDSFKVKQTIIPAPGVRSVKRENTPSGYKQTGIDAGGE